MNFDLINSPLKLDSIEKKKKEKRRAFDRVYTKESILVD